MKRSRRSASKLGPPPENDPSAHLSKHRRAFDHLLASIQSGELKPGDRLPSEAELGKLFDASRITVAKAVHDLQRMGLVTRRPGAGTHVLAENRPSGRTFGLLIPELGLTEIFEPICHGMMRTHFARPDALLWGNSSDSVRGQCQSRRTNGAVVHLAKGCGGIFRATRTEKQDKDAANRRLARALDRAQIPFVLLDRCYLPYPERSQHDMVGVDNRRAGYLATSHLSIWAYGAWLFSAKNFRRIRWMRGSRDSHEALRVNGVKPDSDPVWRGSPQDESLCSQDAR